MTAPDPIAAIRARRPAQLVVEIQQQATRWVVRWHRPAFADMDSSDYLLDLKKPTYASLRALIAAHPDERFEGVVIAAAVIAGLDAGIARGREVASAVGLACFEPVAIVVVRSDAITQHLFWAGNPRERGAIVGPADLANADGSIDWDAEVARIADECTRVIRAWQADHPDDKLRTFALHAVEHVGARINGEGPADSDHYPTGIYAADIEAFVQRHGATAYHACLRRALATLRTDPALKGVRGRGFRIELET